MGDKLNTAIARSLPADQVSAAQSVVRVVTSAIRALGNAFKPEQVKNELIFNIPQTPRRAFVTDRCVKLVNDAP